jgi:putative NADH-flavin reductase
MTGAQRPVAVFGGTGLVGSALLRRALADGRRVRALVRRPEALAGLAGDLDVIPGDARDSTAVAEALDGCAAVLSTLGTGRGDDRATRRDGTATILGAMQAAGVRRLVVMGGFHARRPGDPGNLGQRLVTPMLHVWPGVSVRDTEDLAALVTGCDRDWTLVRSVRVAPGRQPGPYRTGVLRLGPRDSVAPGDVADFMLRCLDDGTQVGRAPMIAT